MFLIIDDSQIDRIVAKTVLKTRFGGEAVMEIDNAKDGIQWLKKNACDQKVFLLLDIRMPEICGFEFLDLFDELPESVKSNTVIVMISSTLDSGDVEMANKHAHVKMLLKKPVTADQLLRLFDN